MLKMNQKLQSEEELPCFSFPVFLNSRILCDYSLQNKLPLELFLRHEGYEVVIENRPYVLHICAFEDHPRDSLRLGITSWRSTTWSAVHYYGKLEFPFLEFQDQAGGVATYGGSVPRVPREVELYRPLTLEELVQNKDRFRGFREGDFVMGFLTQEQIIERAEFITKKYFPGFKLIAKRLEIEDKH